MSSDEPLPHPPGEPTTPPGPANGQAVTPDGPAGKPDGEAIIPSVLPDVDDLPWVLPDLPEPKLPPVRRPRPGFWMSVIWCMAVVSAMQLLPTFVLGAAMIAEVMQNPQRYAVDPQDRKGPFSASLELTTALLGSQTVKTVSPYAQAAAHATMFVFAWAALRTTVGPDWRRRLAVTRPSFAHLALLLLGFPALMLLNEGLEQVIGRVVPSLRDLGLPFDMEQLIKPFAEMPWPAALLVVAVAPGVAEELFCRGFLGQGLVGRYGVIAGIVLTSVFFGLIHMIPQQATFAVLMGVVLHFVYQTGRSLLLPMLLHFLNNGLAVLAFSTGADDQLRFPALRELANIAKHNPGLVYPAAAVLVAAVAFALYRSRARLVDTGEPGAAPWRPPYPGVEYPPEGSGTVVVRPLPDLVTWAAVVVGTAVFVAGCYVALAGAG